MTAELPERASATERLIDVPGAWLWTCDTGGAAEAIVLCHPASQSGAVWVHQQSALVKAGFRVISYSRRGFGKSGRCRADNPGTEVDDLTHVLDALDVKRVHLLGAAAGGGVAMRFAVAHADRVCSLILAGTILSPVDADWRAVFARLGIDAIKDKVSTEFLELGPSYRASNPEGTARFAELSQNARWGDDIRQPSGVTLDWAAMQRTRAPTLLVTGEADLYAPPPLQRLLASHLPVHELATIPEAGHAPYWEAPDAFNALVIGFLRRQLGSSDTATEPR